MKPLILLMLMVFFTPQNLAQAGDDPYMDKKRCGPYRSKITHYAGGMGCGGGLEGANTSSSNMKRPQEATFEKHPRHVMVALLQRSVYGVMQRRRAGFRKGAEVCEIEIEGYSGKRFFSHDHFSSGKKGIAGDTGTAIGKVDINHATCAAMNSTATKFANSRTGQEIRDVWVVGDCCKNGDTGKKIKREAAVRPALEETAKAKAEVEASGGAEAPLSARSVAEKPTAVEDDGNSVNNGSRSALADVPNLAPEAGGIEYVEKDSSVGRFAILPQQEAVGSYSPPKSSPVATPAPVTPKKVVAASKPKKVVTTKRSTASKPAKKRTVKKNPDYTPGELIQRSLSGAN